MPIIEGDPFGDIKQEKRRDTPPPGEVNAFHDRSDVDSSYNAQHHTLGLGHNQASFGDHMHDGSNSRLIGEGMNLTCNTLAVTDAVRIQNILSMLHKIVQFTET